MEGKPISQVGYPSMVGARTETPSAASQVNTHLLEGSLTATLSNTVCLSDPMGEWPSVQVEAVRHLSEFGEIARLDTSLAAILKCIFLTYFDVRCAQKMLLKMAGRTEPSLPASTDFRIVRVNTEAFAEKVSLLAQSGGFAQFGDVAHISMCGRDAIVEYYDMRAARGLLTAAGSSASPWTMQGSLGNPLSTNGIGGLSSFGAALPQSVNVPGLSGLGTALPASISVPGLGCGSGGLGVPGAPRSTVATGAGALPPRSPSKATNLMSQGAQLTPLAKAALAAEEGSFSNCDASSVAPGANTGNQERPKAPEKGSNRPVRTKVTAKEFQKYDIDPEKIQRGEDPRTTVMVRNLTGQNARKDFLMFLEKCGLHEKYTFFYMPCKEHRNVPAGFAFLNFDAPADIHKLYVMVKSGFWREFISDPQSKAPAMSYARFQGHEELVKHFTSSAVLHEQDPDKRPIFRVEAAKTAGGKDRYNEEGGTGATGSPKLTPGERPAVEEGNWYGAVSQGREGEAVVTPGAGHLGSEAALHAFLDKGAKEIAALLMRKQMDEESQAASAHGDKTATSLATKQGPSANIPEDSLGSNCHIQDDCVGQGHFITTSLGA